MCGRFTLKAPAREVADLFAMAEAPDLTPRYNVAPTQQVLAVRAGATGREFARLRWGLVPHWATDAKIGGSLINARAETVAEKPAFRTAFARRRCLIPADGFFEWQKAGTKKLPFWFHLRDGKPFAFAGLWEKWGGPEDPLESCAIITTQANDLVRPYHERMPVILDPACFDSWLSASAAGPELREWLRPFDPARMIATPVSARVNSPRNDDPACLTPAP
jgi:putative SOS response-associated peptidase YedK